MYTVLSKVKKNTAGLKESHEEDRTEPPLLPLPIILPQVKVLALGIQFILAGFLSLSLTMHCRCGLSLNARKEKST